MDNLRMEVLPGEAGYVDGLSYYIADTKKTITLVEELFYNDDVVEEVEDTNNATTVTTKNKEVKVENKDDVTIEVLNSTTTTGLAAKVSFSNLSFPLPASPIKTIAFILFFIIFSYAFIPFCL
jgi:hypothetical protein